MAYTVRQALSIPIPYWRARITCVINRAKRRSAVSGDTPAVVKAAAPNGLTCRHNGEPGFFIA
jgi:hypothetical protein